MDKSATFDSLVGAERIYDDHSGDGCASRRNLAVGDARAGRQGYKNHIVFSEVVKPERLVYKHVPEGGTEPGTHESTVTFVERGGKTEVTMRMLFASAAAREFVVKTYNAIEGGNQTLGRLGEYLKAMEEKRDAGASNLR